jgi:hypothetical protein
VEAVVLVVAVGHHLDVVVQRHHVAVFVVGHVVTVRNWYR